MGRELTRRYSLFFERVGKNPFSFALDIYKYGKFRELFSFLVWECLHKLRLFPKERYLRFNNEPLTLEPVKLNDARFHENVDDFFGDNGLDVVRESRNWKLLFIRRPGEFFGCLYPDDKALYKSVDDGKSITFLASFPKPIKSIFVSSEDIVFVCVKGTVYKSSDGESFEKSLEFASSESVFRNNNGMTETPDKTLIVGEYGNVWDKSRWRKLAYLYFSVDSGETWDRSDFLIRRGTNKHVHLVKYSQLLGKILVADGDNKKKLWVSSPSGSFDVKNPQWKAVNQFHIQMGGYTSVAESGGKILFGTDYQGGTNFAVESRDCQNFVKRVVPDPYRRSPIDNMVQRKSRNGNEIWANLPFSTSGTKCLLMYTADGGESWNRVVEYSRATHTVWLVSSSDGPAEVLYFSITDSRTNERTVYRIADRDG